MPTRILNLPVILLCWSLNIRGARPFLFGECFVFRYRSREEVFRKRNGVPQQQQQPGGSLFSYAAATTTTTTLTTRTNVRLFQTNHQTGEKRDEDGVRKKLKELYAQARDIRTRLGHDAAVPYYHRILRQWNPDDITAATRIAASPSGSMLQRGPLGAAPEQALSPSPKDNNTDRTNLCRLKTLLQKSRYNHYQIGRLFGVPPSKYEVSKDCVASGPVYLTPAEAGSASIHTFPLFRQQQQNQQPTALACLASLFLLSVAVPTEAMVAAIGNEESVQLLQDLGLVTVCSFDPELLVPRVHVFPLDLYQRETLYLVTDLHPRVLSSTSGTAAATTTSTTGGDGDAPGDAVMYIGPDSLALVQHFMGHHHGKNNDHFWFAASNNNSSSNKKNNKNEMNVLDLCTGSGIQALAALRLLGGRSKNAAGEQILLLQQEEPPPKVRVACVDVNPRAIRFAKVNAILNGCEENMRFVRADLLDGTTTTTSGGRNVSLERYLEKNDNNEKKKWHLVLANPPFLPVPPVTNEKAGDGGGGDDSSTPSSMIQKRYGLFSSGGTSGEAVLEKIVELSGRILDPNGGVLAVVSEFFFRKNDREFDRIRSWWRNGERGCFESSIDNDRARIDYHGDDPSRSTSITKGVLFTNEFPIDAKTYAYRRADNRREEKVWLDHVLASNITVMSPGLLYLVKGSGKRKEGAPSFSLTNCVVPQTPSSTGGSGGAASVWTPSNTRAILYTQAKTEELLLSSDA